MSQTKTQKVMHFVVENDFINGIFISFLFLRLLASYLPVT